MTGFTLCARAIGVAAALATASPALPRAVETPPWLEDPFPSTYRPPAHTDLIIRHTVVLDGIGGRIDDGDVLVRDGKIAAVGKALPNPAGAREIDGHGRWVTPGVIDVHSHDGTYSQPQTTIDHDASDVAELSDPNAADTWIETAVNPQDPAFSRALASGVTTLQILPGSSPIFSGRSVVVKPLNVAAVSDMKVAGAAAGFKMTCGENPKSNGAETEHGPTSRQGVVAFMRRAFLDAQRYRRDWDRHVAGSAPAPARDLKREALAGIMAGDIRVNMHCYRASDQSVMMAIAREFGFRIAAFHHATESYKITAQLKAAGTCAAVWSDWWGFKMEALDAIRANAALLDRAGVCVMMHSDSAGSGQRLNTEAAKVAGAARRLGIVVTPEQMIRWTTSTPARLLGLEKRVGTIAPGFDADIVLWSGNPFSIVTRADLVLIDGGIAYDRSTPPSQPPSDFELGRAPEVRS